MEYFGCIKIQRTLFRMVGNSDEVIAYFRLLLYHILGDSFVFFTGNTTTNINTYSNTIHTVRTI